MRRWLAIGWLLAGCGGQGKLALAIELESVTLSAGDIGSLLVVAVRTNKGCAGVQTVTSPLDDPELEVEAHALFVADGVERLLAVPAVPLSIYVEGFRSASGQRPAVVRGCSDSKPTDTTLPIVLRDVP